MLLSVIVPAYNEEKSLEEVLKRVFNVPILKEVIVVNDASRDATAEILKKVEGYANTQKDKFPFLKEIKAINKEINQGKGAAIRTGLKEVSGDIVLIQDADLEINPEEYPKLLEPFEKYGADVVFGSRFRIEGACRAQNFWHYQINNFLTIFSNMLSGLRLTDMETCYKVFKKEIILSFNLKSNRFGIEPEFVAKTAKLDLVVYEVPISYNSRTKKQGKKIRPKDGLYAIAAIIWYNLFD